MSDSIYVVLVIWMYKHHNLKLSHLIAIWKLWIVNGDCFNIFDTWFSPQIFQITGKSCLWPLFLLRSLIVTRKTFVNQIIRKIWWQTFVSNLTKQSSIMNHSIQNSIKLSQFHVMIFSTLQKWAITTTILSGIYHIYNSKFRGYAIFTEFGKALKIVSSRCAYKSCYCSSLKLNHCRKNYIRFIYTLSWFFRFSFELGDFLSFSVYKTVY